METVDLLQQKIWTWTVLESLFLWAFGFDFWFWFFLSLSFSFFLRGFFTTYFHAKRETGRVRPF